MLCRRPLRVTRRRYSTTQHRQLCPWQRQQDLQFSLPASSIVTTVQRRQSGTMAFRQYPDGDGCEIRLYDDDGRMLYHPLPQWQAITQMTSRMDDVIMCTYPKSGTHWLWEIVHMLMTGDTELTSLNMTEHMLSTRKLEDLDKLPSPRVLTTHRQFQDLPSDFIINKRKLVLVLRDPRDVCVSFYNFCAAARKYFKYEGTFGGFITLFLQGKVFRNSWSRWVLSFEKGLKEHPEIPYHAVYYEQLKEDPVKEIGRLAEFLGVDPSVADTVAEKTKFSDMKSQKTNNGRDPAVLSAFFDDNRFNANVFRKGESGGWKEWFSEEQLTHFNDTLCEQLGRSSIQPLL